MGSSAAATAAAAAYYTASAGGGDRKHGHHGLAFWPNEYKYPGDCGGGAFGAQSWCNPYPYAARVPSHMDTHGAYLNPASISAVAAAAEQDRRDQSSFHDTYGALRNPYGGADIAASPYPPPGKNSFHTMIFFSYHHTSSKSQRMGESFTEKNLSRLVVKWGNDEY